MNSDSFHRAMILRTEIEQLAADYKEIADDWDCLVGDVLGATREDPIVANASHNLKSAILFAIRTKQERMEAEFASL